MVKQKKKSTIKKVLSFIGIGVLAAGSIYALSSKARQHINDIIGEPLIKEKLDTPTNLAFDEKNGVFTWDAVENAEKYEVVLNGESYKILEDEVDTNIFTIDYEELSTKKGETFFAGDEVGLQVKAIADDYYASSIAYQEFVFEDYQDCYHNEVVNNFIDDFTSKYGKLSINSIDYLNFDEGSVNGKIDYTKGKNDYFLIFSSQNSKIKDDTSFENFYNTFINFSHSDKKESQFIQGKIVENDICKQFLIDNIDIDKSQIKDIVLFQDTKNYNRDNNFYSLCVSTEQEGVVKYHLYGLCSTYYGGPEDYLTQKLQEQPETFKVFKYQEFSHSNEKSEYLERLQQDIQKYYVDKEKTADEDMTY